MNKVFLLAFLLAVASAKLAVEYSGYPLLRQDFLCWASKNVTGAIPMIWDQNGETGPFFLYDYINMRDAGLQDLGAVAIVNDEYSPEEFCNGIVQALPLSFNSTIWLQVKDFSGLWSLPVNKRLYYLESLVKGCQSHGLKLGVYSSGDAWAWVFGDQAAGSDVLSALPLWYYNTNKGENFDDFYKAGFGKWDKPTMKTFATEYFICGGYYWGGVYYEN